MKYSEIIDLVECEQLDELSKSTLKSYLNKADFDARLNAGVAEVTPSPERKQKYIAVAKQRIAGIKKANDKLKESGEMFDELLEDVTFDELVEFIQTEEYAQLDELSKQTLASYIKKASADIETKKLDPKTQRWPGIVGIARKQLGINKAKEKLTKEEEQLDELSKQTLASYIKNAPRSIDSLERSKHNPAADKGKLDKKIDNRKVGLDRSINKIITKEDEQLDELSVDASERYIKKAFKDYNDQSNKAQAGLKAGNIGDKETSDALSKASKRLKGIAAAHRSVGKKIFGENEQLDELSKQTLGSYIKKASSQEFKRGETAAKGDVETLIKQVNKSDKRQDGIKKAVDKLTKESTHEISYTQKHDILGTIVKSFQVNESVLDEKLEELKHIYGVSNVKVKEL